MPIIVDQEKGIFHLRGKKTSYIFKIYENTYPMHLFWGGRLRNGDISWFLELPYRRAKMVMGRGADDPKFSSEFFPFEYPSYGTSDFRPPAVQICKINDGTSITDFRYKGYRIIKGKPAIEGLPATYSEDRDLCETLEIELYDNVINARLLLYYTLFEEYDVITRWSVIENRGNEDLRIDRALSMSIDFKDGHFKWRQLSGTTLRERHIVERELSEGLTQIDSTRGISSHVQNPFIALTREGADENRGECYGINLVYSGNFAASAYVDQYFSARVQMGINPFNFSWLLNKGQSFSTPEAVMVYSEDGLNGMSRKFHKLYRERLCRGVWRDRVRPVLVNNWEATYFNFDHEKIMSIARTAKELGIELMVLDDGWFGKRNSDNSSLGDWFVNKEKLTKGIDGLCNEINALGLKFGLWFEPEMISPDSELYRKHSDWCIHVEDRKRTQWRNQLVLDMSRDDVCQYLIESISSILKSANIEYIKWDHNRRLTELGSSILAPERMKELSHRYTLGVYKVLDELTKRFPYILFENCASGGGRFDPGMMYYFQQTWTSDNTDAIGRLKIQHGTSMCYAPIMMTAHVSAVPNHQLKRTTPLKTRGDVAMAANFGYELDLTKLSEEEKAEVKKQVELYKDIRKLVQFGNFYRLKSPFHGNLTSWLTISDDKSEFILWVIKTLAETDEAYINIKLHGIEPSYDYICMDNNMVYGGDALMHAGLVLPPFEGDFASLMWRFKAVSAGDNNENNG